MVYNDIYIYNMWGNIIIFIKGIIYDLWYIIMYMGIYGIYNILYKMIPMDILHYNP